MLCLCGFELYSRWVPMTVGFIMIETDSIGLNCRRIYIYVNTHNKSLLTKDSEDPRKWSCKYCC